MRDVRAGAVVDGTPAELARLLEIVQHARTVVGLFVGALDLALVAERVDGDVKRNGAAGRPDLLAAASIVLESEVVERAEDRGVIRHAGRVAGKSRAGEPLHHDGVADGAREGDVGAENVQHALRRGELRGPLRAGGYLLAQVHVGLDRQRTRVRFRVALRERVGRQEAGDGKSGEESRGRHVESGICVFVYGNAAVRPDPMSVIASCRVTSDRWPTPPRAVRSPARAR